MEVFLPALLAFLIGAVHFFGEEIDEHTVKYNYLLVSFSAGLTIAYFFLALVPETIEYSVLGIQNLSPLLGISLLYILEEVIYQRDQNFGDIKYRFKELHTVFLGVYHVAIGMVLLFLYQDPERQMLLFLLPVIVHTAVNSLAVKEMHEEMLENNLLKVMISGSSLIGVSLGAVLELPIDILYTILGVLGGSFIYMVIHDAMDPRKERPFGFLAGLLSFLLILTYLL